MSLRRSTDRNCPPPKNCFPRRGQTRRETRSRSSIPRAVESTINFTWADPEGNPAASFYLQVAKSPYFASDSILVDRNGMQSHDFRLAGKSPGTYYWRLK